VVLDGETYATIANVNAGTLPYAMAADGVANQIYVANYSSGSVTMIDIPAVSAAWPRPPKFRAVALAERASGDHQRFVDAAKVYLDKLAAENDFAGRLHHRHRAHQRRIPRAVQTFHSAQLSAL
jgi:hypothetical protein